MSNIVAYAMEVVLLTENSKPLSIIKKYRISIIAIFAFVVALCSIFAFAGNESGEVTEISEISEFVSSENVVSESPMLKGEGIYIDGCFVAAVASAEEAETALDNVLSLRVSALGIESNAENSFNNKVEVVSGEYAEETFTDVKGVVSQLAKKKLFSVASEITDYNGDVLPVKLSVRSVSTYSETVVIEHETKTVYTDALRDGVVDVHTKGYDGEGKETYQVVSIDGVPTNKELVSLDVTVEPTNEVVRIGTRSNGMDVASLGTFIKPYDGIITSYFGARWGRTHGGLDIWSNDCFGKPIVSASDGIVVRADSYGGYGLCVIVDHGNGVQTLYAHMSAISVNVGDTVSAGDELGKIGNTGVSTGAHLHFEVHVDGEQVNPLIFVDYE